MHDTRAECDRVKQQTKPESKWDEIRYSNDGWSSNRGILYTSVTDANDLKNGLQTLRQHFFIFHDEFGSKPPRTESALSHLDPP